METFGVVFINLRVTEPTADTLERGKTIGICPWRAKCNEKQEAAAGQCPAAILLFFQAKVGARAARLGERTVAFQCWAPFLAVAIPQRLGKHVTKLPQSVLSKALRN